MCAQLARCAEGLPASSLPRPRALTRASAPAAGAGALRAQAHLENGDKIILPPSALERLASLHIDYPMLFEVSNQAAGRSSHCGVLEFSGEEGHAYIPYWMMENLVLSEGELVNLRSVSLPKGTFVKLQPHSKDFLDISNPKAVLETTLRNYSCLTLGDTICVHYNAKKFYIDIKELKPAEAVTIIETDCEVDFAPPLDYVPPTAQPAQAPAPAPAPQYKIFKRGRSGRGKGKEGEAAAGASSTPEAPKFSAFQGGAARLDGKAIKVSARRRRGRRGERRPPRLPDDRADGRCRPRAHSQARSPSASPGGAAAAAAAARSPPVPVPAAKRQAGDGASASAGGSAGSAGRKTGKLVFGGGRSGGAGAGGSGSGSGSDAPAAGDEAKDKAGDAFKAFAGSSRRLCD